mmetsp:Transcript_52595/g.136201  ORF Transcript_52595/g.136201 Transcript_52595/m.136201 type:complete len:318 (-) Transcript_52595:2104-3057(-)
MRSSWPNATERPISLVHSSTVRPAPVCPSSWPMTYWLSTCTTRCCSFMSQPSHTRCTSSASGCASSARTSSILEASAVSTIESCCIAELSLSSPHLPPGSYVVPMSESDMLILWQRLQMKRSADGVGWPSASKKSSVDSTSSPPSPRYRKCMGVARAGTRRCGNPPCTDLQLKVRFSMSVPVKSTGFWPTSSARRVHVAVPPEGLKAPERSCKKASSESLLPWPMLERSPMTRPAGSMRAPPLSPDKLGNSFFRRLPERFIIFCSLWAASDSLSVRSMRERWLKIVLCVTGCASVTLPTRRQPMLSSTGCRYDSRGQ